MSSQKFSPCQREAIWLAHEKKSAYTRALIDVSSFHIDHIIPETLADNQDELEKVKTKFNLSNDFDIFGYENLLPSQPSANLQKGKLIFDPAPTHYFLGIASSKKKDIEINLKKIEKRNDRGKALILLQRCLERGELSPVEIVKILEEYNDQPQEIFHLIEGMRFSDGIEVRIVDKANIEELRGRPIRLGQNEHIDGVNLTNDVNKQVYVRTCIEYDKAIEAGFYALTTFDMKMATFFEHQCGLLKSLQGATTAEHSFIDNPRVGVVDLEFLPFSLFPNLVGELNKDDEAETYQSKITDGKLVVKRLRQNMLCVEEPSGMGQQLIEVARADFNGDGIEDILLFEYSYATQGTFGYGSYMILTRKTSCGLFESALPHFL